MTAFRTLLVIFFLAAPAALAAQWSVAVELGTARYSGTSRDRSGSSDSVALRPFAGTTGGVRVARQWARVGVSLGVTYGSPGIAGEATDLILVFTNQANVFELTPGVSYVVARVGAGGDLRVEAGPAVALWSLAGVGKRVRIGAHASLAYQWPVAERFSGSVRAGVTVTPSIFSSGELPSSLARRATWRRGVSVGVAYQL
jgi:hypothetical protein